MSRIRVLKSRVNWMEGYSNDPRLQILLDRVPESDEMRYDHKEGLYFAEKDGYVRFYYYSGPGRGFGGQEFPITMLTGVETVLIGPWSSRAGVMNKAGFTPCVEVSYTTNPEVFGLGHTFYGGSVTLEVAKQAVELIEGVVLKKVEKGGFSPDVSQDQSAVIGGRNPEFIWIPVKEVSE